MKRILVLGVLTTSLAATAWSVQKTWDGGGGDGLWDTAANWDGDTLPASTDTVLLDNSSVSGSYSVTLPTGATTTTIAKLTITPLGGNTITLTLPSGNTAAPGFSVGDATASTDDIVLDTGAILKNSSGAASGNGIEVNTTANGTCRINNGGRYVHNTARSTAGIVPRLSTAAGTEAGVFEYDSPGTGNVAISASGQTYGSLTLTRTAGSATYSSSGGSALTVRGDFLVNSGVTYSTTVTGEQTFGGNFKIDGALANSTGTQIYTFTGSGKTISGAAATVNFETWNINSGASITLSHDTTVGSGFTATITGTLNCAANLTINGTMTGSGAVNLSKAGTQSFTVGASGTVSGTLNWTVNNGSTTTGTVPLLAGKFVAASFTVASGGTLKGNAFFDSTPLTWSGVINPGTSPGEIDSAGQAWNAGGTCEWEINNANGNAGLDPGWDLLLPTVGGIDVQSTSGNPFTIKVISLTVGNVPGNMVNFSKDTAKTWTVAAADTGNGGHTVTNFAANKFAVNYSAVSNDLGGGVFTVVQEPDDSIDLLGDSIRVRFVRNQAPAATSVTSNCTVGASVKILIADITSDPDSDSRLIYSLAAPAHGTIETNSAGTYLVYTATDDVNETFSYTIQDNRNYRAGIDTVRTATANITITKVAPPVSDQSRLTTPEDLGNGTVRIKFRGIPAYKYALDVTDSLSGTPVWTPVVTNTADGTGLTTFTNTPSPPDFYRARFVP